MSATCSSNSRLYGLQLNAMICTAMQSNITVLRSTFITHVQKCYVDMNISQFYLSKVHLINCVVIFGNKQMLKSSYILWQYNIPHATTHRTKESINTFPLRGIYTYSGNILML